MKRFAEQALQEWYSRKKRKPLVLRGARQVGKSTLVRNFAKSEKLKLIEINFEVVKFKSLEDDALNIDDFISEIEVKFRCKLGDQTILFLDEIQKSPSAFMMLRYFYELFPQQAVIAAGSLLEFLFEDDKISVPVGRVEYFHLGPMSFGEFLLAVGDDGLYLSLEKAMGKIKVSQFDQLQKRLHEYLFVGGMPEAIQVYIDTGKADDVSRVHESILSTYADDFPKYAKKASFEKVSFVFSKLHQFVGRKVKYSEISQDYQSKELRHAIELLERARMITRCFHSNGSDLSLKGTESLSTYKLYFLDVGLLCHQLRLDWSSIRYLFREDSVVKGAIYEQFIAQHLAYIDKGATAPVLYYWLRDKKSVNAEVDFLVQLGSSVVPVEVKSSPTAKLKSLHQFLGERSQAKGVRFDTSDFGLTHAKEKISTSFYMDGELEPLRYSQLNFHLSQVEYLFKLLKE